MNPCDQVKLISECFIKPKYEVEESKKPHYLAPDDLIMLSMQYMQKGLLFTKPPNFNKDDLNSLLENLKHSLSLALVHFYPLAGRLATEKYEAEHCCWIYVDCNKGPGARFIHAQVVDDQVTLTDIARANLHSVIRSFFDIGEKGVVNHDGHTRALVSVQVTELVDGIFMGFTMNHTLADGTSLLHFMETLSEIFKTSDMIARRLPIYRRPTLNQEGISPAVRLPYLDPNEFITRFDEAGLQLRRERVFHFSASSMAKLKAKSNANNNGISSFQSLCGLVWECITRARNLPPDVGTSCSLVVNSRSRVEPPLLSEHFGNYGLMANGRCKVGELLEKAGSGWAAMVLHQAVVAQDDKAARAFLKTYVDAPFVARPGWSSPIFASHPIVVSGSARFDAYGPEFGLGKAVAIRAGYANKDDGKVVANPGREGGGSVDLEISLAAETMSALESDEEFISYVSY